MKFTKFNVYILSTFYFLPHMQFIYAMEKKSHDNYEFSSEPISHENNEVFEQEPPHKKRRKSSAPKKNIVPELFVDSLEPIAPGRITIQKYEKRFSFKDDSDEENNDLLENQNSSNISTIGVRLKLLTNVYLRNIDQMANIFLPRYTIEFDNGDCVKDFFKTKKNEICVFASGGLQNTWENNIAHVYSVFFKGKVKIIRARWMQKHLAKEKNNKINLEKEFKGKENELHSEYYYDFFFKEFFIDTLKALTGKRKIKNFTVNAFSWWDVCNCCERTLTKHKDILTNFLTDKAQLSYKINASRRYRHNYPLDTLVTKFRTNSSYESEAWKYIWRKINNFGALHSDNPQEKEKFWTKTKDGLELCKWLGQAFEENRMNVEERGVVPNKRGDVLKFYSDMSDNSKKDLKNLLSYLREKNWELSCWYKRFYPKLGGGNLQPKWKKNWKQMVIPHFNWELIGGIKFKSENEYIGCELCGKSNLRNPSWIFHPKFRPSNKFLTLSDADQNMTEKDRNIGLDTPFENLPNSLKQKRKQSLVVGADCVKIAQLSHQDLKQWFVDHPEDEIEEGWLTWDNEQKNIEQLEMVEKQLKNQTRKKRKYQTILH